MSTDGMHLLHVVTDPGVLGNAHRCLDLIRGLTALGVGCTLACQPGSALQRRAREHGLGTLPVVMRHAADWPAVRTLREFIRRRHVHVVHAHDETALGLMALATRGGLAARVVTRCDDRAPGRIARLTLQRGADHVLATTADARRSLVSAGWPDERVSVIAPGVRMPAHSGLNGFDPAALRAGLGLGPDDAPVVMACSRFEAARGLEDLIDATCQLIGAHPSLRLVLIGDGEERTRVGARATRAGVAGHLRMPGHVADIQHVLPLADAYVEPDLARGHDSGAALAMAARRPVVAVGETGASQLLHHERTGLIVAPGDVDGLAAALDALLSHPRWAAGLGSAAHRLVRERHSLPAMVQDVRRLYERLLTRTAGAG